MSTKLSKDEIGQLSGLPKEAQTYYGKKLLMAKVGELLSRETGIVHNAESMGSHMKEGLYSICFLQVVDKQQQDISIEYDKKINVGRLVQDYILYCFTSYDVKVNVKHEECRAYFVLSKYNKECKILQHSVLGLYKYQNFLHFLDKTDGVTYQKLIASLRDIAREKTLLFVDGRVYSLEDLKSRTDSLGCSNPFVSLADLDQEHTELLALVDALNSSYKKLAKKLNTVALESRSIIYDSVFASTLNTPLHSSLMQCFKLHFKYNHKSSLVCISKVESYAQDTMVGKALNVVKGYKGDAITYMPRIDTIIIFCTKGLSVGDFPFDKPELVGQLTGLELMHAGTGGIISFGLASDVEDFLNEKNANINYMPMTYIDVYKRLLDTGYAQGEFVYCEEFTSEEDLREWYGIDKLVPADETTRYKNLPETK